MESHEVTYRLGTPGDILILCELGQQLNSLHHAMRPDIYAEATQDFKRDAGTWLPSLEADNQATYIAELGNVPIGFIALQVSRPTSPLFQPQSVCRINSVCVSEEQRGRGVGRMLMSLAESWAKQRDASDIRLTVWTFNEKAISLYEELGYEVRAFEMGKRIQS